jgi:NADH dehydrogenase [ubiquinone] 1 alpha subcomplex assembly factor 7
VAGSLSVAQYMELCLCDPKHGYYASGAPIGAAGDFTTAPEISQMFGELIGVWAASAWQAMGAPPQVNLVELGPGRGTMIVDVLRAARVMPGFLAASTLHLIEISRPLERLQREALASSEIAVSWHRSLASVPKGPLIILANEFVDALPVHQAVLCADGWHERVIRTDEEDRLCFSIDRDPIRRRDGVFPCNLKHARIGDIFEWRSEAIATEIGNRVARSNGVALIIDYGHTRSMPGDTLQAVGDHRFADPLLASGSIDLTAHVDFQALASAAERMGARVHGPVTQARFLLGMGIAQRAASLKAAAPGHANSIDSALQRLTDEADTGMGGMIRAMAFSAPEVDRLAGFEA